MSFAPSASSLSPSLAWSLGNGGKGREQIKFPSDLGWYHKQSCTRFRSLQHRKEPNGFRHEFIVLSLTNGSICRVERMGDLDAWFDAISSQGSVARDVVQYYGPNEIADACLDTSEVLTETTFPCELDLIEVLRSCRAIHEGEKNTKLYASRF